MSQENVELARRLYGGGDLLDTTPAQIDRLFREDLDEDFEFRLPAGKLSSASSWSDTARSWELGKRGSA